MGLFQIVVGGVGAAILLARAIRWWRARRTRAGAWRTAWDALARANAGGRS